MAGKEHIQLVIRIQKLNNETQKEERKSNGMKDNINLLSQIIRLRKFLLWLNVLGDLHIQEI